MISFNAIKSWFYQQWVLWGLIILAIIVILCGFVYLASYLGSHLQTSADNTLLELSSLTDPTERGLAYIGVAIIISAIIRAIFNK
ncbi:hypothetical protein LCGC14_0342750 [marine sediment metagenome]|uniref:Uncharacterized protein n=1 Tax=marine sediment metagenome TaxID=412755 RepID=A0A0F9TWC2_9ZZZZ